MNFFNVNVNFECQVSEYSHSFSFCCSFDQCNIYFSVKNLLLVNIKVFYLYVSRKPLYWQCNDLFIIGTHKYNILSGGSSQIYCLEAGKLTFDYTNLIRWENVVFTHFLTTYTNLIRLESSKVNLLASKPSI